MSVVFVSAEETVLDLLPWSKRKVQQESETVTFMRYIVLSPLHEFLLRICIA